MEKIKFMVFTSNKKLNSGFFVPTLKMNWDKFSGAKGVYTKFYKNPQNPEKYHFFLIERVDYYVDT